MSLSQSLLKLTCNIARELEYVKCSCEDGDSCHHADDRTAKEMNTCLKAPLSVHQAEGILCDAHGDLELWLHAVKTIPTTSSGKTGWSGRTILIQVFQRCQHKGAHKRKMFTLLEPMAMDRA